MSNTGIRPWHIAGFVLVAAVIGLVSYAFWPSLIGEAESATSAANTDRIESRARIDVTVVQPSDFVLRAEATGHLTPWRVANISAEGSGRLLDRPIEEGQRVSTGDVLVRLDDEEQRIAVAEAESALLNAQIEYAGMTTGATADLPGDSNSVAEARAAYETAELAFDREEIELDALRYARRTYEAAVLRSGIRRDEVQATLSGLAQAEQQLDRARLMLNRMVLYAPFSGRISDLKTEVGQNVGAGTELLTLLDDTRMKVDVDVLEDDLVHLSVGGTARIRIPALEDTVLTGTIFSINPSIDPETGTGRVRVAVSNPRGSLISGLFSYVELETGREQNRLVVPTEAVLVRQGRDLVFVVEDGRAQWVYVTVGQRSGDLVELIEPVSPGDSVAVAGHHALAHDARVEVGEVVPLPDF